MRPAKVAKRQSDAVLFEAVLGTDPSKCPRCRRVDGAAWTIAVAVHVVLLAMASGAEPSLETWSARLAAGIHEDLAAQAPIAVEAPPLVEPPVPEEPPPVPAPEPAERLARERPPSEEPPVAEPAASETEPNTDTAPPAEAGNVLTADEPEGPVDFTDNTFVTGSATAYAGGASVRGGSQTGPGPDRIPTAVDPGRGTSGRPSQARPVQLGGSEWRCDWPAAAMSQDIYEQFVVLRVVVNADGTVERARAVSDPGFGFGEAAAQCARRTRFTPARDDLGQPVRATSPPIRVRFTR